MQTAREDDRAPPSGVQRDKGFSHSLCWFHVIWRYLSHAKCLCKVLTVPSGKGRRGPGLQGSAFLVGDSDEGREGH
jgi:hypothetical protein